MQTDHDKIREYLEAKGYSGKELDDAARSAAIQIADARSTGILVASRPDDSTGTVMRDDFEISA